MPAQPGGPSFSTSLKRVSYSRYARTAVAVAVAVAVALLVVIPQGSAVALAVTCSPVNSHQSPGAPSIAHFAMGGMTNAQPFTTHLQLPVLLPKPKKSSF
jgi:hypothetical protein